jgi:choline dehydrogenase-like flavoprotein
VLAKEGPRQRSYTDPGHSSIATLDFVHRNGGAWGGGVLFDVEMMLPLAYAELERAMGEPSFGAAHKRWMSNSIGSVVGAIGIGQEVPDARSAVVIDHRVKDRFGMPAALIRGETHPSTIETTHFMENLLLEWINAIGGNGLVNLRESPGRPPVNEHSAGTCRLGDDPDASACDRYGRVHGAENVWVADASLHPTNGSVNPGLTVLANAFRVAEMIASQP